MSPPRPSPEPTPDRDADSLDGEPVPRRKRSSAETAKLGADAQQAIRMERIEASIDRLTAEIAENRRDTRAVIKALEGRTRVSEQCLSLVRRVAEGLLAPTRGTITLAALAVVAITVVVAPTVLIQTAPEIKDAVLHALRATPAEAPAPAPVEPESTP